MELVLKLKRDDIDDVSEALWSLFPLWTETDSIENEFEVAPVIQYAKEFTNLDEEGYCIPIYIATKFIFRNQSRWEGYLRYNGDVTAFTVFKDDNQIGQGLLPVNQETSRRRSKTFADELGMTIDDVFPIVYCSKMRYGDHWIGGLIDK